VPADGFRLAQDVAGSSSGSHHMPYERLVASDPLTQARALAAICQKHAAMLHVRDMEDM
jgi:hypothetical protein